MHDTLVSSTPNLKLTGSAMIMLPAAMRLAAKDLDGLGGSHRAPFGARRYPELSNLDLRSGRPDSRSFRRRLDRFDRRHWQSVGFVRFICAVGVDLRDEAVFVPRGIDVATTDKSLCIDPIERGKSRSRKIESNKLTRRHKEETMSYSRGVSCTVPQPSWNRCFQTELFPPTRQDRLGKSACHRCRGDTHVG